MAVVDLPPSCTFALLLRPASARRLWSVEPNRPESKRNEGCAAHQRGQARQEDLARLAGEGARE